MSRLCSEDILWVWLVTCLTLTFIVGISAGTWFEYQKLVIMECIQDE